MTSPQIDFSALSYPSDAVTLGAMRRVHPKAFAQEEPDFFEKKKSGDVGAMVYTERVLAHNAFAKTANMALPHPDYDEDRDEFVGFLSEQYCDYGISSGLQHTQQLIRTMEDQAGNQAALQMGTSPGV